MSIESLPPDMKGYTDPHYLKLVRKINELVKEANENFQSTYKIRNEIKLLQKDLEQLKMAIRNYV